MCTGHGVNSHLLTAYRHLTVLISKMSVVRLGFIPERGEDRAYCIPEELELTLSDCLCPTVFVRLFLYFVPLHSGGLEEGHRLLQGRRGDWEWRVWDSVCWNLQGDRHVCELGGLEGRGGVGCHQSNFLFHLIVSTMDPVCQDTICKACPAHFSNLGVLS
jgi:hypothetical protein